MTNGKYPITYHVERHPDGLTVEEVKSRDRGGCDEVMIIAVVRRDDGWTDTIMLSMEGRTGEPSSDEEWFKAWTLLAKNLAESKTLGEGRRLLAANVFELVRRAMTETPRG